MRLLSPAAIVVLAASTLSAAAQDVSVCYNAGLSYSSGAVIAIGNVPNACAKAPGGAGMVWLPVPDAEVNCFYDGKEYGRGSMIAVGDKRISCARGVWSVKDD
jgi:hypothetical protein